MMKVLVGTLLTALLVTMIAAAVKPANKGSASKPVAAAKPATSSIDAWISDENCGGRVNPDCTKKCVAQGFKLVAVNSADKSVIPVSNQESVKPFIGQHVTITGAIKDGLLTVASIKPVKDTKKK
jgi:hypothetical protein